MKNLILPLLLIVWFAGCKHELRIEGRGDIVSDTTRGCTFEEFVAEDVRCKDNEIDADYIVVYDASPRQGYVFSGWEGCGNQFPSCSFSYSNGFTSLFSGATHPPLVARFSPYNLEAFEGQWFGDIETSQSPLWNHDSLDLEIAVDGETFEFTEEPFFYGQVCVYSGVLSNVDYQSGIHSVSGNFTCNTIPFSSGTFTGSFGSPATGAIFYSFDLTYSDNSTRKVFATALKESNISEHLPYTYATDEPISSFYKGIIHSSNNACSGYIFNPTNVDLEVSLFEDGFELQSDSFFDGQCLFSASSEFQCSDFSTGMWSLDNYRTIVTENGEGISISFIVVTESCSYIANFIGY